MILVDYFTVLLAKPANLNYHQGISTSEASITTISVRFKQHVVHRTFDEQHASNEVDPHDRSCRNAPRCHPPKTAILPFKEPRKARTPRSGSIGPAASYRLGTTGHSELSLYTLRHCRASGSIRFPRHYPGWRAVKKPRLYDLGTFWLLKRCFGPAQTSK